MLVTKKKNAPYLLALKKSNRKYQSNHCQLSLIWIDSQIKPLTETKNLFKN